MISSKQEHINFLENFVLKNLKKTINNDQTVFSFILMAQYIEILGSYLDYKPMRAKSQSGNRFSLAIYKLFNEKYLKANKSNFLYFQLRTCLLHMFIPTDRIELRKGFETSDKKHLSYNNDTVVLFCENLYADVKKATEKIIYLINNDKIKLKKISAGYYE